MGMVPSDLYYVVGEKPPALPCRYETKEGVLIAAIAGATLTAYCSLNGGTPFTVTCTNAGTGEFTINWGTATSSFTAAGVLAIRIKVVQGGYEWYMPAFSIPIKA